MHSTPILSIVLALSSSLAFTQPGSKGKYFPKKRASTVEAIPTPYHQSLASKSIASASEIYSSVPTAEAARYSWASSENPTKKRLSKSIPKTTNQISIPTKETLASSKLTYAEAAKKGIQKIPSNETLKPTSSSYAPKETQPSSKLSYADAVKKGISKKIPFAPTTEAPQESYSTTASAYISTSSTEVYTPKETVTSSKPSYADVVKKNIQKKPTTSTYEAPQKTEEPAKETSPESYSTETYISTTEVYAPKETTTSSKPSYADVVKKNIQKKPATSTYEAPKESYTPTASSTETYAPKPTKLTYAEIVKKGIKKLLIPKGPATTIPAHIPKPSKGANIYEDLETPSIV
ncbi:hypothetical protein DSO57_1031466 [Entomophthora muscae]|uniref:Uncharacterized protein n=1 Tax=Entomophthora muscae TaxID=34485 RepID=A0ACC2RRP9_9FUNG|nr:hypothetical protein DSO57_1031466 [Entomophthora muscae]